MFTFTLEPRVTTLVNDLSGTDDARFTVPILYALVLALVMASFACVQALINAVRTRDSRFIAQIIGVEMFTIFFEVMFLYRGVVEVTMPWIAKNNGALVATAAAAWIGVRGLTWFLFGQYGTPPLLALLARRPLAQTEVPQSFGMRSEPFWRLAMDDFRRDLDWLHIKSDEMLELPRAGGASAGAALTLRCSSGTRPGASGPTWEARAAHGDDDAPGAA